MLHEAGEFSEKNKEGSIIKKINEEVL